MKRLLLALLLAAPTIAHADLRADVHVGGGLEGGPVSGVARPDGVAAAGLGIDGLLPGRDWGFGVNIDAVGRLTSRFDPQEEATFDALWRYATPDRRFRTGVGGGLRVLSFAPEPRRPAETVLGMDLVRIDLGLQLARWEVTEVGASVGVDFYFAWTFGCYSGTRHDAAVGDMRPVAHELRCGDTITTTYVAGLQTSMSWR